MSEGACENRVTMNESVSLLINFKCVCITTPATPGLLKDTRAIDFEKVIS